MTTNEKNLATITHLSVLSQYCIPFGNFIFPAILWSSKKNESEFIDQNGKNVINFQLSMLVYTLVVAFITIPVFVYAIVKNVVVTDLQDGSDFIRNNISDGNLSGLIILGLVLLFLFTILKILELVLALYGSVKSMNGITYRYPLTITFIK